MVMTLHHLCKIDWRSSIADLVIVDGSSISHGGHGEKCDSGSSGIT